VGFYDNETHEHGPEALGRVKHGTNVVEEVKEDGGEEDEGEVGEEGNGDHQT